MPSGPWIMKQNWHDLLFAHWPVDRQRLRELVPAPLELDLHGDTAYVAITPFRISGLRPRFSPPLSALSRFPELNVRTYVRYQGIPGVFFFSLDAGNISAVWGARIGYKLPYFHAAMSIQSHGESYIYRSTRQSPRPAEFRARYWPTSQPRQRDKDSLEHFLTERYCLYTVSQGTPYQAYIHHLPWPLQDAKAEIDVNTMAAAAGIDLPPAKPLLHFSRFLEVLVWWPERAR